MTQRLSWAVLRRGRSLWSRNATPGATVYGEGLRRIDGKEHRRWDPRGRRSARRCSVRRSHNASFPSPAGPPSTSVRVTARPSHISMTTCAVLRTIGKVA